MRSATAKKSNSRISGLAANRNLTIGEVVDITADGHVFVSCADRCAGRIPAKLASRVTNERHMKRGASVLIAFCADDEMPIVIDLIRDGLEIRDESSVHTLIDGDTVVLEAGKQMTLRCGKATISLTKDGKVVVRGTKVTSRASSTNKIKGSTVSIN